MGIADSSKHSVGGICGQRQILSITRIDGIYDNINKY